MNISIILAHPAKGSFNHAIAKTCNIVLKELGHTVKLHDLYKENFDPILPEEEIPKDGKIDELIEKIGSAAGA